MRLHKSERKGLKGPSSYGRGAQQSKKECITIFRKMCVEIGSPFAMQLVSLLDTQSYMELFNIEFKHSEYTDAESFKNDWLLYNFLRKSNCIELGIDTKIVALQNFEQSEVECFLTNTRLKFGRPSDDGVEAIMSIARRKIARLLGEFNLVDLQSKCAWGPGSTYSLTGADQIHVDNKVREDRISVTPTAWLHFCHAVSTDHSFLFARDIIKSNDLNRITLKDDDEILEDSKVDTVDVTLSPSNANFVLGARFSTVPKNVKTDRTILIEPSANIFLQKGVGSFIRSRLLSVGIDLRKQANNQIAASLAHSNGLMTVDLSAASDTISSELVWNLLPIEYSNYLDDIRSQYYTQDKGVTFSKLHKWSSMGNGYTFELESLIFWALTQSTSEHYAEENCITDIQRTYVYGDDIIADRRIFDTLLSVFKYCGFALNVNKSFTTGSFFESCGKHYFNGIDVTPIYLRSDLSHSTDIFLLHNSLVRWQMEDVILGVYKFLQILLDLRRTVDSIVGVKDQFVIPLYAEQNDAFIVPHLILARSCEYNQNGYYRCVVLLQRSVRRELTNHAALYAYSLRLKIYESLNGRITLRLPGPYVVSVRNYLVRK